MRDTSVGGGNVTYCVSRATTQAFVYDLDYVYNDPVTLIDNQIACYKEHSMTCNKFVTYLKDKVLGNLALWKQKTKPALSTRALAWSITPIL